MFCSLVTFVTVLRTTNDFVMKDCIRANYHRLLNLLIGQIAFDARLFDLLIGFRFGGQASAMW
jgi:hypothetical protein